MANNPITTAQIRRILQLFPYGASQRDVASKTLVHLTIVADNYQKFFMLGQPSEELLKLDDQALRRIVYTSSERPSFPPACRSGEAFPRLVARIETRWRDANFAMEGVLGLCIPMTMATRSSATTSRTSRSFKRAPCTSPIAGRVSSDRFRGQKTQLRRIPNGRDTQCDILVCTLPFSKYIYIEAMTSACQENMYGALSRYLEFLGRVPHNVLSDNMKEYVKRNNRYEFTFQTFVDQYSVHYNTNLDATRPRKTKDKPTIENHVNNIYNSV